MSELLRYTTAQAAKAAGRHVETIRRALESGELHGGQRRNPKTGQPLKGARWSIRRECLEAWIDGELCSHQAQPVGRTA